MLRYRIPTHRQLTVAARCAVIMKQQPVTQASNPASWKNLASALLRSKTEEKKDALREGKEVECLVHRNGQEMYLFLPSQNYSGTNWGTTYSPYLSNSSPATNTSGQCCICKPRSNGPFLGRMKVVRSSRLVDAKTSENEINCHRSAQICMEMGVVTNRPI